MIKLFPLFLFAVINAAFAHGGEDHGAPPPPVSQILAPRTSAFSEEFEVSIVVEAKQLLLYLDRFNSNAPVTKAKVEVDGAGLKGLANETAPGIYVMNIATPIAATKHALTIVVDTDDSSDLLVASLDMTQAATASEHGFVWRTWFTWLIAAVLLAALGLAARKIVGQAAMRQFNRSLHSKFSSKFNILKGR